MLLNCEKCKELTLEKVNNSSGLELHRFNWLESECLIGEIKGNWNFLINEQQLKHNEFNQNNPNLIHWTLGGPWFKEQRLAGNELSAEWFAKRDEAFRLWE